MGSRGAGRSFQGLCGEADDRFILDGAGHFYWVAADFAVLYVGLTANRKIDDHRDLFTAIRAREEVFHRALPLEEGLDFGIE
jgi:hypothetical protein